jgi:ribosomal-protein-alanine N-acetyltransferase
MNPITLETKRLQLKGLSPLDMKFIFDNLKKAEIMQILGHRSEAEYLKEEHKHRVGYASYNRSFKLFLLIDKESGKIIGRCGLHNWNEEHKRAEIGYSMDEESFKRKGFMSEAVEVIIEYGFKVLKLNRIEALVADYNVPSLKIIEKNNFNREGLLKQHYRVEDKYIDSILFAILVEDYKFKD